MNTYIFVDVLYEKLYGSILYKTNIDLYVMKGYIKFDVMKNYMSCFTKNYVYVVVFFCGHAGARPARALHAGARSADARARACARVTRCGRARRGWCAGAAPTRTRTITTITRTRTRTRTTTRTTRT